VSASRGSCGAVVEAPLDGAQIGGSVDRQVGGLGKYWRSRPLVFSLDVVARAGPGRRGDSITEVVGDLVVMGHLGSLVPSESPSQLRRELEDREGEGVAQRWGAAPEGKVDQLDVWLARSTGVPIAD
jgi:hypothetical protein